MEKPKEKDKINYDLKIKRPDYDWFMSGFKFKDLSLRGVAHLMRLDPPGLLRGLKGKRKITIEEAIKLAMVLDQPLSMVLTKLGFDVSKVKL